ncbi:HNH endonuclease [Lysinibacillus odysseyi]|uniref:Putative HNH nuclease YajD n=1 Tax=Lysinibacillus odysseyi 34hs-1 = NBRC 100172 TaxID=1220589 RepID=A0A0A3IWF8_9BACI|nr:HNH endonuclease signature motif containing protein [Lysinibacillus odysseyi]KGR89036.1 hypothetical protein CD32_00770 [Lysinibacillus odysseyi 34hs-1 = NBRC 100172]
MSEYKTIEQKRKFYKSTGWKKLRQLALERDNHECQWCKKDGKVTHKDAATLEIDHVKEIEDYPELAYDLENLRTLCKHHHNKRHNRFDGKATKGINWDDEKW